MNDLLQAALELAANRGFRIVPCNLQKKPLLTSFLDASADPAAICSWWQKFPGASVGIYTEGLLGIDVDLKGADGRSGFECLRLLEEQFGPLPETLRSRTGSGGAHYFFTLPAGVQCFKPHTEEYGVSLRSSGGYMVVPPSPHPSGRNYVWENEGPMAEAPEWLVRLTKLPR